MLIPFPMPCKATKIPNSRDVAFFLVSSSIFTANIGEIFTTIIKTGNIFNPIKESKTQTSIKLSLRVNKVTIIELTSRIRAKIVVVY